MHAGGALREREAHEAVEAEVTEFGRAWYSEPRQFEDKKVAGMGQAHTMT